MRICCRKRANAGIKPSTHLKSPVLSTTLTKRPMRSMSQSSSGANPLNVLSLKGQTGLHAQAFKQRRSEPFPSMFQRPLKSSIGYALVEKSSLREGTSYPLHRTWRGRRIASGMMLTIILVSIVCSLEICYKIRLIEMRFYLQNQTWQSSQTPSLNKTNK